MRIGIDASRAFLPNRTGIEEYAYRVIEHLRKALPSEAEVVVYVKKGVKEACASKNSERDFKIFSKSPCASALGSGSAPVPDSLLDFRDPKYSEGGQAHRNEPDPKCGKCAVGFEKEYGFILPKNWEMREIGWKRLWTQGGLSWELWKHPVDALFVPAHTVPWRHPKRTVVVVHGLEYEFCRGAYSFWDRWYMRISIARSCRWAWRVIAVSENTKKDLVRLYGVAEEKIVVIYEGMVNGKYQKENKERGEDSQFSTKSCAGDFKFLLVMGRVEERKNVGRIVEAFGILKKKYAISHRLVLAGKPGYGYRDIRNTIEKSACREEIIETGYVSESEKQRLFSRADVLVFPSLYEGFGLPILEAQVTGVPVVTSDSSSMPEVAGEGAVLVDPNDAEAIANGIYKILSDAVKRERLIFSGQKNVERFSWEKCAREIAEVMVKNGR